MSFLSKSAFWATVAMSTLAYGESNFLELSIEEMQQELNSGNTTSVELVQWYQARIAAYDQQGPKLNASQHANDSALQQATQLDLERSKQGPRTLLHGIPIVIKDNYETVDAPTTAGSAIFDGHWPKKNATQVAKLKKAGAIVLAKTTMHEFAFGWTTRGSAFGVTRNPYNPEYHPGGSSGGTGAAVAANYAAAGMGSDTCGSIRVPSAHNNLVGLRGTQGLSSRHGIVPLSSSRDIGGPLARSTRDLAVMLDATVGYDPLDTQTTESFGKIPESYLEALSPVDLKELRVGVLRGWFGDQKENKSTNQKIENILSSLEDRGASVVNLSSPTLNKLKSKVEAPSAYFVDNYDLIKDLNAYLAQYPALKARAFADLADDPRLEPQVAQLWKSYLTPHFQDREIYLEQQESAKVIRQQLLALLNEHQIDVLVYPTATEEAVPVGREQSHFNCKLSAATGLPAISVPAGFGNEGLPVAIEFLAEPWAEQKLLNLAYTIEQVSPTRRLPGHTP